MFTYKNISNSDPDITLRIDAPGVYVYFVYNHSVSVTLVIECEGAQVYLYGYYEAKGKDKYTIKTMQSHTSPNSKSNVLVCTSLAGESRLDFDGTINLARHARGSHAYQKNQNLIESDSARVYTVPKLEINTPDVYCTHGSTTSTFKSEDLYLLQSRGLNSAQAKALIKSGFKQSFISQIKQIYPEFYEKF